MNPDTDGLRQVLTETLEQFGLVFANPLPPGALPPVAVDYRCVRIRLTGGGGSLELALAMPCQLCRDMAANALGVDPGDILPATAEDAAMELGSITAGNLASRCLGDCSDCKIGAPVLTPIEASAVAALAARNDAVCLQVDERWVRGVITTDSQRV